MTRTPAPRTYWRSALGTIVLGDAHAVLSGTAFAQGRAGEAIAGVAPGSVDLVVTSPPFGLVRKKGYGNADAHEYLEWFRPFAGAFKRVLRETGSLVIDIGGAWIPGQPTRSLYHFKLLLMLCEDFGFHLAQEFYWWNPARLPTPAEWVTVRRIRVKDAVNCIWWLSPTPWPRADNRRVAQPYSASMRQLLRTGYTARRRPSGHDISEKFRRDNGAAIPPNLIAVAHTESNSAYLRFCKRHRLSPHPARFPTEVPEFFVRMLTDCGDVVLDPFAGSCSTGEVCERLARRWTCIERVEEYLRGAVGRFENRPGEGTVAGRDAMPAGAAPARPDTSSPTLATSASAGHGRQSKAAGAKARPGAGGLDEGYRVPRPGLMWDRLATQPLRPDGGRKR